MKKNHSALGFTLIEILVVSAIVTVLVGGALAGFIGFRDRRAVTSYAQQIQGWYVAAQAKAKVREAPSSGCTTLLGYRVTVAATAIRRQALCDTGPVGPIDDLAIPAELSVNPTAVTTDFYSLPVEDPAARRLNYTSLNADNLIVVSDAQSNQKTFTITVTGIIGDVE